MTGSIKDYTPNFNLIIPEFNISGWHDYLEENFRSIDALFYNIFDIHNYKGAWLRLTEYTTGQVVFVSDTEEELQSGKMFKVLVNHTTTDVPFNEYYEANPTYYEPFVDASTAQTFANKSKLYAEGTDEQVASLDVTHSSKGWSEVCQEIVEEAVSTVKNSKITITQAGIIKGQFTLNQAEDQTIALDSGGGGGITIEVDQEYDATSTNPQSGTAVAEAISTKADNTGVMHLTGAETSSGDKTFTGTLTVNTPSVSDNTQKPATTAYINTKFQVVAELPQNPDANTFYFIPEE